MIVQVLRSNKISSHSILQLQEQLGSNLSAYSQKLSSQPETSYLLKQSEILKVYLRCLILSSS